MYNKKKEMENAKLNGQVNKYNELNYLSKSLKMEVHRNPEIIPIFAKALIEHDKSNDNGPDIKLSFDDQTNQIEFETIDTLVKQNNEIQATQRITREDTQLNSFIKNTMNSIMNRNKTLGEVNSLLELTHGQAADHFIASKSDAELNKNSNEVKMASTSDSNLCGTSLETTSHSLNGITDLFHIAAYQQSGNYRSPAKYVPPITKITSVKKQKIKTGLSSLAIIREESRLGSKKVGKKLSAKPLIKQSMSMPSMHLNSSKMRLKTNI
jgi:hypothetical protein